MNLEPGLTGVGAGAVGGMIAENWRGKWLLGYGLALAAAGATAAAADLGPPDVAVSAMVCGLFGATSQITEHLTSDNPGPWHL
jgi:hypothetical protein